jgi:hypothetical protein
LTIDSRVVAFVDAPASVQFYNRTAAALQPLTQKKITPGISPFTKSEFFAGDLYEK